MRKYAINDNFERPGTENGEKGIQNHGQPCPPQLFAEGANQGQEMRQPLLGTLSGLALASVVIHECPLSFRAIRTSRKVEVSASILQFHEFCPVVCNLHEIVQDSFCRPVG